MTGGTWYKTYICKNYTEQCLKIILEMQEMIDKNLYVLFMRMRNSIHHLLMTVAVVVVMNYYQMRQQKHQFH